MSFLPITMFKSICQEQRIGMTRTGDNIKAAKCTDVMCYGVCPVKVKLEQFEMVHDFFIIEDSVISIIGRDFMKKHDVHHRTAKEQNLRWRNRNTWLRCEGYNGKRFCFCEPVLRHPTRERGSHPRKSTW